MREVMTVVIGQPRVTPHREPVPPSRQPALPGGLWLMGCHGGAGVTTLAAMGVGLDGGWRRWPQPSATPAGLLLVARLSASGMRAAQTAAETCLGPRLPQGLLPLGLIAVAAGPGRPPRLARERLDLVAGWVRNVHRIPWVAEALAADPDRVAECQPLHRAIPRDLFELVTTTTRSTS